jgi:hypothetical protein
MNKLMGFLELKESGLPSIPWKLFDENVNLDDNYLWTIRTAITKGDDLNLPRVVGKNSEEAYLEALDIYNQYKDKGIVIYYPYFIADKSGTLEISSKHIVIEAVDKDLWNLVTYNKRDLTIVIQDGSVSKAGNPLFINDTEFDELHNYGVKVKTMFRDYIAEGKSILLEWSYAYSTDTTKNIIGERYLVFYEIRTI